MSRPAIPVIDISPALDGRDLRPVAAEVGEAIRTIGFLQIVGHGVDRTYFHDVHRLAEDLWAQPPDVLDTYRSPIGHPFRGVNFWLDERGAYTRQMLQNMEYDTAEEALAAGYDERYLDFFGGNVWPPTPGLEGAIRAARRQVWPVASTLLRLFALDLGLAEDHFEPYFGRHVSYFAALNYPARPAGWVGDERADAHSDSGALTLLHQSGDYEGLEVRFPDGTWVPVEVRDEALVCNVGDLMARWTNDGYPATAHRVVGGAPGRSRRSIAMHHLPDVDTVIAPIEGCVAEGATAYEPVSMYEWNMRYFKKADRVLRLTTAT